ncbi:MAG: alpha-hydroxy-acid oxidizing protein [Proteobacteria bacterium]|nr:alpha-hydroxy-acid oxidizing protein [Pseudomonadota bacterium]
MTDDLDIQVLHEFVPAARAALAPEHWDYLMGAADTETTYRRNRQALDSVAFRPRVLRDVSKIDSGGALLGHKLRLPVLLAPIGSLQDFTADGSLAPARAAAAFGTVSFLSSTARPELEEVAAATDAPKVYQLYVRDDMASVEDRVRRAVDAGYAAFCFTVDLDYYGRRERDIAKRHLTSSRKTAAGEQYQAAFGWKDIEHIRDKFDIPLILKGIATAEDAAMAAERGIDAVYASNHGGRQLDHGRGGLETLPEIVEAVAGRASVIFDGGIMRGTDVVKAMALGADAVGIGRLRGLAAAAAGEAGIIRALELLEVETRIALGLLGVTSFAELDAGYLHAATPVAPPGPFSAFPLLDEGY